MRSTFDGKVLLRAAQSRFDLLRQPAAPLSPLFGLLRRHYHRPARLQASHVQIRRFFSLRRGIEQLEETAELDPLNSRKQAAFYRVLLDADPMSVVKRFEDPKYARDEECVSFYLAALMETNQLDRAAHVFLKNSDNGSVSSTTNHPLSFINFGTKDRPLYVHNANPSGGGWRRIGTIVNILIVGSIVYSLVSFNEQRLGGITSKVHRYFKKETAGKTYSFDDVQGCDEAKKELEEIVEFLKNPAKFNKLGAKMPKGVLLVGPPGTGKTLLAKAVAGEADVPFIYASGSQFDEVFVGVGSMRIRQMFESAKEQAPAIIFIDEIDALGSKRNPRDPQHSRMSLNQLLTEMDGFAENTGVVVIAATNLPESLDRALLRPGRFDRHVFVPLPDVLGRRQILDMYLRDVRCGEDVDVGIMARATPGFSGAELFKMINQAKIAASVENGLQVTMAHLEAAKDEMIMGTERKSAIIVEADRRVTAYHESGHAIAALFSKHAHPIHKATIIPRGRALGMVTQLPERDELSISKAQLLARMDVAMGGRVAEQLIFGDDNITTGASSDFEQANSIARAMVTQYGMSDKVGPIVIGNDDWEALSPHTRELVDGEVRRFLEESQMRTKTIMLAHRLQLDRLAAALLEYETLTKEEIEAVVAGRSIKQSIKEALSPQSTSSAPKFDLLF